MRITTIALGDGEAARIDHEDGGCTVELRAAGFDATVLLTPEARRGLTDARRYPHLRHGLR